MVVPFFSLPQDNFEILITDESCRTGNNGKINITASHIHDYVATLTGSIDTVDYEFFDKVEIRNVRADTYELCIRIIGEDSYLQCFSLVVTEPQELEVFTSGRITNGRIAYELSGSDEYIVEVNGLKLTSTGKLITLSLEHGKNTIKIKTPADCQGTFEDVIYFSEDISLSPNPFNNNVKVYLKTEMNEEVSVNIFSVSGSLISSQKYHPLNGIIDINTTDIDGGMYIIDIKSMELHSRFKAIKK